MTASDILIGGSYLRNDMYPPPTSGMLGRRSSYGRPRRDGYLMTRLVIPASISHRKRSLNMQVDRDSLAFADVCPSVAVTLQRAILESFAMRCNRQFLGGSDE